jgi:dimethyl sulfoxide reductase iron-sulfur subunit
MQAERQATPHGLPEPSDTRPARKLPECPSRRDILRLFGALGAVAAVGVPAMSVRRAGAGTPPGATGAPGRQWGVVIDLRKCEACVTQGQPPLCVEACNLEHSVPPGQQWLRIIEMEGPGGSYFMPRLCMNCENAPCVNVCPVRATYHNAEGVVLIDQDRCIGCRQCMAACPYGARSFNWDDPPNPPEASFDTYRPEFPLPHRRGVTAKCMLCAHHLEDGRLPACADGCPMFAIYLADLNTDLATNGQEVVQFSRFIAENNAYRVKEELGTRPRVWYVPGHGQEYDRQPDDEREPQPARNWIEMRADGERPRGSDLNHDAVIGGQS